MEGQKLFFVEQAEGYVKALKNRLLGLALERSFWTLCAERLDRRKEAKGCFEGSVFCTKW
jgi:hypothetical protein